LREHLIEPPFFVSHHGAPPPPVADLAAIRAAIRAERKLRISYGDEKDERTIWPFAIAYFAEATLVNAWCELRDDLRHFRADRMRNARREPSPLRENAVCPLAKPLRLGG
jgi:predicted DNA-binding transcriptional regulator YafY